MKRDYCHSAKTSFCNLIGNPKYFLYMDDKAACLNCAPNRIIHLKGEFFTLWEDAGWAGEPPGQWKIALLFPLFKTRIRVYRKITVRLPCSLVSLRFFGKPWTALCAGDINLHHTSVYSNSQKSV